jgi:hypothetical protein
MRNRSNYIIGLLAGAVLVLCFVFMTGAVHKETSNLAGHDTASFRNMACSADGRTVYAMDAETVYRSIDGGGTWSVVLQKKASQP